MKLRPGSALLLLCFFAASARADVPAAADADIDRANRDWARAIVKGDARSEAEAYAPDAVFCDVQGSCTTGHDAIEKMMQERLAQHGAPKSASAKSTRRVEDGGLVYEWGVATLTTAAGETRAGRFLTVWRRQADGRWKILRNLVLP